jgi:hypothetical protein
MWPFKKKFKAFGGNITHSCRYCRYNYGTSPEMINCRYGSEPCKYYSYDPTKRIPDKSPKILGNYTDNDFKL